VGWWGKGRGQLLHSVLTVPAGLPNLPARLPASHLLPCLPAYPPTPPPPASCRVAVHPQVCQPRQVHAQPAKGGAPSFLLSPAAEPAAFRAGGMEQSRLRWPACLPACLPMLLLLQPRFLQAREGLNPSGPQEPPYKIYVFPFFPPFPSCLSFFPQVNEDLDHRTLLRKYERELRRLRAELQQKSKDLVDKRLVLQVCAAGWWCCWLGGCCSAVLWTALWFDTCCGLTSSTGHRCALFPLRPPLALAD
jgi:hypothetical protein